MKRKNHTGPDARSRQFARQISDVKKEVNKVVFGQEKAVDSLIKALICNGNVLVEGIPGIGKTLLIKAMAQASGCSFNRVQFTVDLLPSDVLGLTSYEPKRGFETIKGPIFANFIIADEINRSPPKTQSAFMEAMQEGQVTIGKTTYKLPQPFFVMANQNPIETEGVYNLPEAQIDRFLFKITMQYPPEEEEEKIMETNVTFKKFEDFKLKPILSPKKIKALQKFVHEVYLDERIKKYIFEIVDKTRKKDFKLGTYIDLGASPRAGISAFIAAKAQAMMNGRSYVVPQDVKDMIYDVMRHRIILSYRAMADKITTDMIIDEILKIVKVPEGSSKFKR